MVRASQPARTPAQQRMRIRLANRRTEFNARRTAGETVAEIQNSFYNAAEASGGTFRNRTRLAAAAARVSSRVNRPGSATNNGRRRLLVRGLTRANFRLRRGRSMFNKVLGPDVGRHAANIAYGTRPDRSLRRFSGPRRANGRYYFNRFQTARQYLKRR